MKPKTTSTWAPLKATIFRLYQRSKQRTGQRRRLKDQIRDRDETIAKLRAEVNHLKAITQPERVFDCHYPAQMMVVAVFIVLHGGSLRCSDIIESIFGRYKNKGGMKAISADVLSIALYNQALSSGFVQTAMKSVTSPMLDEWRCDNVCHNRYGVRRRMEKELKCAGR